MEAKLKEYRAIRRRKELIDNTKEKIEQSTQKLLDISKEKLEKSKNKLLNLLPKFFPETPMENKEEEVLLLENEEVPESAILMQPEDPSEVASEVSDVDSFEVPDESWKYCLIKWAIFATIWLLLWMYFLKIQFGAVYFVISVLIGIYLNTRTRPKKKGEVSAYSVFNRNCVSINGTLKAEQFEREIRYGAGTVRPF